MDWMLQDLRRAARSLRRAPAFTTAVVLTLALGIGANTAVFSIVNAALIRALPYPHADRLMVLNESKHGEVWTFSPPDFVDVRARTHSFDGLAATNWTTMTLTGAGEPVSLDGYTVTEDFLHVIGARPALGRTFVPAEFEPGAGHEVILSDAFWRERFDARADVVGSEIRLNGEAYTVVGVLPAGAGFPRAAKFWIPLSFTADVLATQRGAHWLETIARLKDGVSEEAALADVRAVIAQIVVEHPDKSSNLSAGMVSLRQALVGDVRTMLLVLLGTVTLVLLVACTNVANLVLARAAGRTREIGVSIALGARRSHLLRRSLAESALLALAGGVCGVLLAGWLTAALVALQPGALRSVHDISLDPGVLAYSLVVTIATGIAFGLAPVLRAGTVRDLHSLLRAGGRGVVRTGASWRVRGALVASQLALAVMLLSGAALLIRSFVRLQDVDPGFSTSNAFVFRLGLPDSRYGKAEQARAFYDALLPRLAALPGVTRATATSGLPLDESDFTISLTKRDGETFTLEQQEAMHSPQIRLVTAGYLRALHVPFVSGRDFEPSDGAGAPLVAIVNEAAARLIWNGTNPMGHSLEIGTKFGLGGARGGGTVIGVVRDFHDDALARPANPTVYLAHAQFAVSDLAVLLNTAPGIDARALTAPVRTALHEVDAAIPAPPLTPFDELRKSNVARPRFAMLVICTFAALALLLAAVGVYGVMAGLVAQRESEIGIRMALGAGAATVMRETLQRMLAPVAIGAAAGVSGAFLLARLLQGLLYDIPPSDPVALGAATAVLIAVAFAASYLPARRASRVDPIEALRAE